MNRPFRVTLAAPPANYLRDIYGFRRAKPYRNQPPLGIGYIASTLLKNGYKVTLFDAAAEGWNTEETAERIVASNPNLIGITAITFESASAFALAKALKARSNTPIVLGGAHANSNYPRVLDQCPDLDFVAAGDGEPVMLDLCTRMSEKSPLEGMPGMVYRKKDGRLSHFIESPPVKNLDTLPPPAYELFPNALYRPLPHRALRLPSACMITSRGCSYARCIYCELSGLIKKTYRRHSPERVIEEMRALISVTGARDIYFQDDIFITEPEWVFEFCELLEKSGLDVIWSCESRFQGVTPELLRAMKKAGCRRIYYGFETGSQELLEKIRKGFTLEEARTAATTARQAGIEVVGFFMLGLPGETPEQGRNTVDFSISLGLSHAVYSMTDPQVNTDLYAACDREGTLIQGNDYNYKKASFLPKSYRDVAQLESLRSYAFRRFYLRPAYWWQCLKNIKSIEDLRFYLRGLIALFSYLD